MGAEGRLVNRRIRRLGIGLVALFGLLFAQVSYIQVFAASGNVQSMVQESTRALRSGPAA